MAKKLPYVTNGLRYEPIWDYNQNMALYGVKIEDVREWKLKLKEAGAVRFRVVKNEFGKAIICFKWIA